MNTKILFESIQSKADLFEIAQDSNISIDYLRQMIIEGLSKVVLCDPNENILDEEKSICNEENEQSDAEEYNTDNEEDTYDRIIKKSKIQFSNEQLEFMEMCVKQRQNIALLAPAGYGKSKTIDTLVELFKSELKKYSHSELISMYGKSTNTSELMMYDVIGVCSSTARSAQLITGAKTLHSFLGIGLGKGDVDSWVKRVSTLKFLSATLNNLKAVQVIIIDEISMISAQLLDKISEYLQKIRKNLKPFGGVQMIFSGDIAQLSPVVGTFFFRSREVKAANVKMFKLTKCFRQENDLVLMNILNEIRIGQCSSESLRILTERKVIDPEYANGMQPLRIVSTNAEADIINERELLNTANETQSEIVSMKIQLPEYANHKKIDAVRKMDNIPEEVKIVVGCQIVITQNLSRLIVNGTQGRVIAIRANEIEIELVNKNVVSISYVGYKDPDHLDVYTAPNLFHYLPCKLAYASTIHKCQGMTLELLEIDLSKCWCHGQSYVALSRVKDLRGLVVKGLTNPKKQIICDERVKAFLKSM